MAVDRRIGLAIWLDSLRTDLEDLLVLDQLVRIRVRPARRHPAGEDQRRREVRADVGRQEDELAPGLQHPTAFLEEPTAVEQMLEHRKGEYAGELAFRIRNTLVEIRAGDL